MHPLNWLSVVGWLAYVAIDGLVPERSDAIARTVAALTRRGIGSVARRIESEEQAQAARDVGFGFLQGWHFAAPARLREDKKGA